MAKFKNVYKNLWEHNDSRFELEIQDDLQDLYLSAYITPQEETGLFYGKCEKDILGIDRDNIITQIYCPDAFTDSKEYKHYDYKHIMNQIYQDFKPEIQQYILNLKKFYQLPTR